MVKNELHQLYSNLNLLTSVVKCDTIVNKLMYEVAQGGDAEIHLNEVSHMSPHCWGCSGNSANYKNCGINPNRYANAHQNQKPDYGLERVDLRPLAS